MQRSVLVACTHRVRDIAFPEISQIQELALRIGPLWMSRPLRGNFRNRKQNALPILPCTLRHRLRRIGRHFLVQMIKKMMTLQPYFVSCEVQRTWSLSSRSINFAQRLNLPWCRRWYQLWSACAWNYLDVEISSRMRWYSFRSKYIIEKRWRVETHKTSRKLIDIMMCV